MKNKRVVILVLGGIAVIILAVLIVLLFSKGPDQTEMDIKFLKMMKCMSGCPWAFEFFDQACIEACRNTYLVPIDDFDNHENYELMDAFENCF